MKTVLFLLALTCFGCSALGCLNGPCSLLPEAKSAIAVIPPENLACSEAGMKGLISEDQICTITTRTGEIEDSWCGRENLDCDDQTAQLHTLVKCPYSHEGTNDLYCP